MKAYIGDRFKKGAALRWGDVPKPVVNATDVLVEVHAAGVNQLDAMLRDGDFRQILPLKPPFIAGHDVAGIIVRVGAGVTAFRPGDAVYARPRDSRIGTFAERIAIDQADVALKPRNLSMEEAAAVPLAGLTAWQALVVRGNLQAGQSVFVQAGSGGVGHLAIQLAKGLGASVATTTSAKNAALVRALGADVVIDYRKEAIDQVLSGYDLVLNSQGRKTLDQSLRVVRPGGKIVSISGPPDAAFADAMGAGPLVNQVFRLLSASIRGRARRRGVDYSFLFMAADGAQLATLTGLIEAGALRPSVDRVFPFEAANDALAYVESGHARGKVIIKVR